MPIGFSQLYCKAEINKIVSSKIDFQKNPSVKHRIKLNFYFPANLSVEQCDLSLHHAK
jgi:hypothetical protein